MSQVPQALLNVALSIRADAERRGMIEYLDGQIDLDEFWRRMQAIDARLNALSQ